MYICNINIRFYIELYPSSHSKSNDITIKYSKKKEEIPDIS